MLQASKQVITRTAYHADFFPVPNVFLARISMYALENGTMWRVPDPEKSGHFKDMSP